MNLVRAMHGRLPAVVVKYELPCMRASVTVGSGWYLLEDGDLFLVVAAHWWAGVMQLVEQGARTAVQVLDGMTSKSPSVPLGDASELPIAKVLHDALQIDFAMIYLRELHRSAVMAHPSFLAFDRASMRSMSRDAAVQCEAIRVLGYPTSEVRTAADEICVTPYELTVLDEVLPAELADLVASQNHTVRSDWIYFRIAGTDDLPSGFSVKGMSGGPVVALINSQIVLIGMQTLWWGGVAAVGVQPVNRILEFLDKWREFKRNRCDNGGSIESRAAP